MTENKPIIINGVDVSKCKNFKSNHDCIDSAYHLFDMAIRYVKCEKCKDCYFKQLARKTQECERWKHQAELASDTTDRFAKQLEEKERECEELKKVNIHIEHNRIQKANKLMRIEKIIKACESGYTDEFIQSLLEILLAAEPAEE